MANGSVSGDGMAEPVRGPSLKRSLAYRWRIPVSAASILLTVGLVARFQPVEPMPAAVHHVLWDIGWLLLVAGVVIRLWAASCLGGRKSAEVVCVGPYSVCRNPLYVGTFLIAISQIFFYESLWVLAGLAGPVLLYAFGVVPAEERKLRAGLGEAYREYCATVPRWWPRLMRFQAGDAGVVLASPSFRLEALRCGVWLCLPLLAAAIGLVRGTSF